MSGRRTVALLLLSLPLASSALDILTPERAFPVAATFDGARLITVTVAAAPGYAIYRDRLVFELEGTDARLERIDIERPPQSLEADETAQHVGKLRGSTQISLILDRIPLRTTPVVRGSVQGCADVAGICLPPHRFVVHPSLQQKQATTNKAPRTPSSTSRTPTGASTDQAEH